MDKLLQWIQNSILLEIAGIIACIYIIIKLGVGIISFSKKDKSIQKTHDTYLALQTTMIFIIGILIFLFLIYYPTHILKLTFVDTKTQTGGLEQFVQIIFTFIALIGATIGFFIKKIGEEISKIPTTILEEHKKLEELKDTHIQEVESIQDEIKNEIIEKWKEQKNVAIDTIKTTIQKELTNYNIAEKISSILAQQTKSFEDKVKEIIENSNILDIQIELEKLTKLQAEHLETTVNDFDTNRTEFEKIRKMVKNKNTISKELLEEIFRVNSNLHALYQDRSTPQETKYYTILFRFKILALCEDIRYNQFTTSKESELKTTLKNFINQINLTNESYIELQSYKNRGRRLDDNEKNNINDALKWANSDIKIEF